MEHGLTEEEILRLAGFRAHPAVGATELVALAFAEKMALDHASAADDEFFRRLRAQFTDPQIVELGMAIGQYIGFGRLLMVLDLESAVCEI